MEKLMNMQKKVAFVTGAGGGIGKEICVSVAKEKIKVVLFGGKNLSNLEKTANEIKALGGDALIFSGDLTDQNVLCDLFDRAVNEVGGIDILINNAGLAQSTPFNDITLKEYDDIMNVNVRVPFLLTQKALPYLEKSNGASIVNVCSVVAHSGYALQSIYSASKHALLGMTKALAKEVYKKGIRVHAVSPGGVYTDMIKVSRPDLTPDGMPTAKDVADIIMFLIKNRTNAVIDEICFHRASKEPF